MARDQQAATAAAPATSSTPVNQPTKQAPPSMPHGWEGFSQAPNPMQKELTKDDRQYLHVRGWLESHDGNWLDMSPPPDQKVRVGEVKQDNGTIKVIEQTHCHGFPGMIHTPLQAINTERKRNRGPLPVLEVVATRHIERGNEGVSGGPWIVRDARRQYVAGPFLEEELAHEWVRLHSPAEGEAKVAVTA